MVRDLLSLKVGEFSISLVDDETIHRLNRDYLNHDYATDILTFNYKESDTAEIEGEIIISYETAELNAKKFNVSASEEIFRLLIHGILHLTGFDDKTAGEKSKMKKKEDQLLKLVAEKLKIKN